MTDSKIENPSNLYAELTKPERFHMIVPMMIYDKLNKEVHLPMVVLNAREDREVKLAAYNETVALFKQAPKKDEFEDTFKDVYDTANACWTFYYATRVPGKLDKKFFESKPQVEDQYTSEQLGILSNAYLTVKLNQPHLKMLNAGEDDAFESIIKEIINSGTQPDFFLNSYTTHSLKQLIHYLIARQETSRKHNGLSGMLSEDTMQIEQIQTQLKNENETEKQ